MLIAAPRAEVRTMVAQHLLLTFLFSLNAGARVYVHPSLGRQLPGPSRGGEGD